MASLCHPWFTTTNLSYRFPIFETSATALCGTTGSRNNCNQNIPMLFSMFSRLILRDIWLIDFFGGGELIAVADFLAAAPKHTTPYADGATAVEGAIAMKPPPYFKVAERARWWLGERGLGGGFFFCLGKNTFSRCLHMCIYTWYIYIYTGTHYEIMSTAHK